LKTLFNQARLRRELGSRKGRPQAANGLHGAGEPRQTAPPEGFVPSQGRSPPEARRDSSDSLLALQVFDFTSVTIPKPAPLWEERVTAPR
jgi:hypothetical protein